jgi:hypothetical protein
MKIDIKMMTENSKQLLYKSFQTLVKYLGGWGSREKQDNIFFKYIFIAIYQNQKNT